MKAGWAIGFLFTAVLGFAGICQSGLLGGRSGPEQRMTEAPATSQDVFTTSAGWRYQRGQPNHWKYLVMKR